MSWELLETPNPDEFAIRLWVPGGKGLQKSQLPVAGVTRLKNFLLGKGPSNEGYGDYVYTYPEGFSQGGQDSGTSRLAFHFAPFKTPEQMRIPFDARVKNFGNHRWHEVLKSLSIVADYANPRSGNIITGSGAGIVTGPSYRILDELLPELNEGTTFYVEEFTMHTWGTIPKYRVPVPLPVNVQLPGGESYRHGELLYGDIRVQPLSTANLQVVSGSVSGVAGFIGEQRLRGTNFKHWAPYWILHEQVRQQGVIYARRVRVRPPRVPRSYFGVH